MKKAAKKDNPAKPIHLAAEEYLASKDKKLAAIISRVGHCTIRKHDDYFVLLAQSIISQQVSLAAAATITKRFKALYNGKPTPKLVLNTDDDALRGVGLSRQKASYMKSLAEHFENNTITPKKFSKMTDQEIIDELIQVKGIGVWTAEMFLIFSLGREDVFSYGDLGLRNSIYRIYFKGEKVEKEKVLKLTKKWAPYRSIACWYVWAAADTISEGEKDW